MRRSLWDLLNEYKVVIPIIQRDYAQGRNTDKISLIRENILNALFDAIKGEKEVLELDFIYGYTNTIVKEDNIEEEVFYPLDGQQRLTTLFLLYWFIAVKEGKLEEASENLSKFTYEIRHSSRIFCSELVKYDPENLNIPIKDSIINEPWFFTAWINDPTIDSMLTMLNAIQEKVDKNLLFNVWERLTSENPAIIFHLLPTDKLGMPDDLYIKMNSRGKELTDFEYFKIRFSEILTELDEEYFNKRIDQNWSDLFWDLYKDEEVLDIAQKVDKAFLRFFRYITDITIEIENIDILDDEDEFQVFKKVYSREDNVKFIFNILDIFHSVNKTNPEFFSSLFYKDENEYHVSKTRIFFTKSNPDLFKKCSDTYDSLQRNNPFSIGEQLLLYACIIHLKNDTHDFNNRIRKARNLIVNSEDTVRRENMSSLLKSVREIIISGELESESRFNKTQQNEEIQKEEFLKENPQMLEIVYLLEDHSLLQGCTAIFDLNIELNQIVAKFYEIFTSDCNYLKISRALFTLGDYSQVFSWRNLIGNYNHPTWRDLFTPSNRRVGFERTKKILKMFLDELIENPTLSIEEIIDSYLALYSSNEYKEKNWNYYFIKYKWFRYHTDGFYYWKDENKQYESIMMRRKTLGGFHWDPFLYAIMKTFKNGIVMEDNYNKPITYVNGDVTLKMTNQNNHFKFEAFGEESEEFLLSLQNKGILTSERTYKINQSEDGVDVEDRVLKGIEVIENFNSILERY